jgi:branched-chain amino acid transport system substrate-binding protein
MRLRIWIPAIAVAIAIGRPALVQAQDKKADPIRIGAIVSATGGLVASGIAQRDGILLAQKDINAQGGIDGRPLEILIEDDGSNPDSAMTKVDLLVHSKEVNAVIGPTGIAATVAIGAVSQAAKVPLMAFTGLGPPVEATRTCVFHLTPSQELNARSVLTYIRDNGGKSVGVLHDSGYGQVIWTMLSKLGAEYGVNFVSVEKFDIAATDVTTQAAKIKAANPDFVIVLASQGTAFRNLRQVGVTQTIVAPHGSSLYEVIRQMGDGANNVVHAEFLIAEEPLPNQVDFVNRFKAEYGHLPKQFEAAGWDAVMVVAAGLKQVGPNPAEGALCAAIREPYAGVFGKYDFSALDMGGLTLGSISYSMLKNGQLTRLPYRAPQ